MGNILTNINNPAQIKTISPNRYSATKDNQQIKVSGTVNKNSIIINPEYSLSEYNIKKDVIIWNKTGILNTPINNGSYGSVYLNYDDKTIRSVKSFNESSYSYALTSRNRPTYCGVVAGIIGSYNDGIIGAYNGFLFIGNYKKMIKYSVATSEVVWEIDLSSYLDNSIGYEDGFFANDSCIFLACKNNSTSASKVFSILQSNGEVVSVKEIGSTIAQTINMDVSTTSSECHLYIHQSGDTGHSFYHMVYNITTGAYVSQTTSGIIDTYYGMHCATFDANHNCISWSRYSTYGDFIDICVFNASNASLYMHYADNGIWDNLQYATTGSNPVLIFFNLENKLLALYYGNANNDGDMAVASMSFTSSGLGDISSQQIYEGLGTITARTIKKTNRLYSSNRYYGLSLGAGSDYKFFISFYATGVLSIDMTERANSANIGNLYTGNFVIDPKSNIIYYYRGNNSCAFRDNSISNLVGNIKI